MAILSYAKTTKEMLALKKARTSRIWKPTHTRNWQRWYDNGRYIHQAYDKSPRNGGECIGYIRLAARPTEEYLWQMTDLDLIAEGGMCKTLDEFCQLIGHGPEQKVTVLWFDFKPLRRYVNETRAGELGLTVELLDFEWYGWDGTAVVKRKVDVFQGRNGQHHIHRISGAGE